MRPEAEVLAILGTGHQALSHYNVFTEMFPFKEVQPQTCLLVKCMNGKFEKKLLNLH